VAEGTEPAPFGLKPLVGERGLSAGEMLTARVTLHTEAGLLINMAYRGREAPAFSYGGLEARLALEDAEGELLATATSGFA
jgi:hypothetical protein